MKILDFEPNITIVSAVSGLIGLNSIILVLFEIFVMKNDLFDGQIAGIFISGLSMLLCSIMRLNCSKVLGN